MHGSDALALAVSTAGLLGLVRIVDGLHAAGRLSPGAGRSTVHVVVGLFVVASPAFFVSPWPLMALAGGFALLNVGAIRRGWFRGMHAARSRSFGTVTFPLALALAVWWGWIADADRVPVFQAAFLVLAVCDPLASWVGRTSGHWGAYGPASARKSAAGSAAFLAAAMALVAGWTLFTGSGDHLSWSSRLAVIAVAAVTATVAEAVGRGGWDNLWIVAAVTVSLVTGFEHPESLVRLAPAATISLALVAATTRWRMLDRSGGMAAGLLAFSILWLAGWAWLVPGATFFVLSSALSRAGADRKRRAARRTARAGARDAVQVGSNGGVAWAILLTAVMLPSMEGSLLTFAAFCGAFAAAAADTWSTELGSLSRSIPRLVTTGRPVPAGTSGGITWIGLAASVAGALTVATASWVVHPWLGIDLGSAPSWMGQIVAAGVLGGIADSVVGATVQARYLGSASGQPIEIRPAADPDARPVSGWAWVTNDTVNLFCTLAGAILALVFLLVPLR